MTRVLFVCLGNICRSPMAEGIFRDLLVKRDLRDKFSHDSCGTGGWHVDESPDPRAQLCLRDRGIEIGDLRGRQLHEEDFETFDFILAMDRSNREGILDRAYDKAHHAKVRMMLDYHPDPKLREVPDPYFGADDGFSRVYEMLRVSCENFLNAVIEGKDGTFPKNDVKARL